MKGLRPSLIMQNSQHLNFSARGGGTVQVPGQLQRGTNGPQVMPGLQIRQVPQVQYSTVQCLFSIVS